MPRTKIKEQERKKTLIETQFRRKKRTMQCAVPFSLEKRFHAENETQAS